MFPAGMLGATVLALPFLSALFILAGTRADAQTGSVFGSGDRANASVTGTPESISASDSNPMLTKAFRDDATLHDVAFVDSRHGWACGDRGTILHTSDGGQTWALQPTNVEDSLFAISFVDAQRGFAVGGMFQPHTGASGGVILTTEDGGRSWHAMPNTDLPMLTSARFVSPTQGWVAGLSSERFPASLFITSDGGRTWRAGPSRDIVPGWVSADFPVPGVGSLVDAGGRPWTFNANGLRVNREIPLSLRRFKSLVLNADEFGWMVGEGGSLMQTVDAGRLWIVPDAPLPRGVESHFDFNAVAMAPKGRAWIAGAPGTRILRTTDYGATWESVSTGQSLPIRALTFVDESNGWAVGDMGLILGTHDGGATWDVQRAKERRAAILCIVADCEDLPAEMLTYLSACEGYRSIVAMVGRRDPRFASPYPCRRLHEAAVRAGGCGAVGMWRFPLGQKGLTTSESKILDTWDRANDGDGRQQLRAAMVRAIRTWRPEIVVTYHPNNDGGGNRLQRLVAEAAFEAARDAADPMAFPEHWTDAGLDAWQVKRLHGMFLDGSRGELTIDASELAVRLGRPIADLSAEPNQLVGADPAKRPRHFGFESLIGRTPITPLRPDLLAGLNVSPGGDARRTPPMPPIGKLDALKRMAKQRRNLQAIMGASEPGSVQSLQMISQIGQLTASLDDDMAARALYDLGRQYHMSGSWNLAAQAMAVLAEEHPRHPLAVPALVWLTQYNTSREAFVRTPDVEIPKDQPSGQIFLASNMRDVRSEQALYWAKRLASTHPEAHATPEVRFPLAVAQAAQGQGRSTMNYYLERDTGSPDDGWALCAAAEVWIDRWHNGTAGGEPPKPLAMCPLNMEKPLLDGRLNEMLWASATRAVLQGGANDDPSKNTTILLARDAEHLFIGMHCPLPTGVTLPKTDPDDEPARPRDADLSQEDRVDIFLDIDRDYATYYRLTVDRRGWGAEDCWGDSTWDPDWYIATDHNDTAWTAEIAVPIAQLTGQRMIDPGSVWSLGLQRTTPGVGFQSWSKPAGADPRPEGFGFITFE